MKRKEIDHIGTSKEQKYQGSAYNWVILGKLGDYSKMLHTLTQAGLRPMGKGMDSIESTNENIVKIYCFRSQTNLRTLIGVDTQGEYGLLFSTNLHNTVFEHFFEEIARAIIHEHNFPTPLVVESDEVHEQEESVFPKPSYELQKARTSLDRIGTSDLDQYPGSNYRWLALGKFENHTEMIQQLKWLGLRPLPRGMDTIVSINDELEKVYCFLSDEGIRILIAKDTNGDYGLLYSASRKDTSYIEGNKNVAKAIQEEQKTIELERWKKEKKKLINRGQQKQKTPVYVPEQMKSPWQKIQSKQLSRKDKTQQKIASEKEYQKIQDTLDTVQRINNLSMKDIREHVQTLKSVKSIRDIRKKNIDKTEILEALLALRPFKVLQNLESLVTVDPGSLIGEQENKRYLKNLIDGIEQLQNLQEKEKLGVLATLRDLDIIHHLMNLAEKGEEGSILEILTTSESNLKEVYEAIYALQHFKGLKPLMVTEDVFKMLVMIESPDIQFTLPEKTIMIKKDISVPPSIEEKPVQQISLSKPLPQEQTIQETVTSPDKYRDSPSSAPEKIEERQRQAKVTERKTSHSYSLTKDWRIFQSHMKLDRELKTDTKPVQFGDDLNGLELPKYNRKYNQCFFDELKIDGDILHTEEHAHKKWLNQIFTLLNKDHEEIIRIGFGYADRKGKEKSYILFSTMKTKEEYYHKDYLNAVIGYKIWNKILHKIDWFTEELGYPPPNPSELYYYFYHKDEILEDAKSVKTF